MKNETVYDELADFLTKDYPEFFEELMLGLEEIERIAESGCAANAIAPVVRFKEAQRFMEDHGDDVIDYIEENTEIEDIPIKGNSWESIASVYLGAAIEIYAQSVMQKIGQELELIKESEDFELVDSDFQGKGKVYINCLDVNARPDI